MHPILSRLRDEFAAGLAGLDAAQTQLRPAGRPAAWSIQQITEHLMLTYAMTRLAMDARLEKGTPTRARATLANRVGQCAVTMLGVFPNGRIAPERVQPPLDSDALSGAELSSAVTAALDEMDARLEKAQRTFGPGRSVSHMVLGPMNMTQWRRFHLAHARHHLKQIAQIRRQL
jgi:hypothetical protein